MKKLVQISLSISTLCTSFSAHATFTTEYERGEKNVYFNSPNGVKEVCVIPKHYPNAKYKEKDLKKEKALCSYSFYPVTDEEKSRATDPLREAATCAKLNSTNPAVNIFTVPQDKTIDQVEANKCSGVSKIGKYKNSTSCSYAPSIVGYYHLSRILGGIGRVPPSVLRTMDIKSHLQIVADGKRLTKAGDLINQTWSGLGANLSAGLKGPKKDLLVTDDGDASYGAFIMNPKHEDFYKNLFTAGTDRAAAFRDKNPIFQLVKKNQPLSEVVENRWDNKNVQNLFAMRDATEFILLDHIMNQQDRFGNIAEQQKVVYMSKNPKDQSDIELTVEGSIDDYNEDKKAGLVVEKFQPLTIQSMILKDNDCGVTKTNVVKTANLLQQVAHINPKTYKKLLQFQNSINANKEFFTKGLLFTEVDFKAVVSNLNDAVNILKNNCKSGKLRLDLDIETYLTNPDTYKEKYEKQSSQACELDLTQK